MSQETSERGRPVPELVLAVADCAPSNMPIKKGTFHSENVHR